MNKTSKTSNTDPATYQMNIRVCARHANAMQLASDKTMLTKGVLLRALIDSHLDELVERLLKEGVQL